MTSANKTRNGINAELARILARRRAHANRYTSNVAPNVAPRPRAQPVAPRQGLTPAQANAFWRELQALLNARRRRQAR